MTHLPPFLCLVQKLTEVGIRGNPLQFPPPHVISQGWPGIKIYLSKFCKLKERLDETTQIVLGKNDFLRESNVESRQSYTSEGPVVYKKLVRFEESFSSSATSYDDSSEEMTNEEFIQER